MRKSKNHGCLTVGSLLSISAGGNSEIMQFLVPFCWVFYFFVLSVLCWMSGKANSAITSHTCIIIRGCQLIKNVWSRQEMRVKNNWTRVLINANFYITMEKNHLVLIAHRQKLSVYFLSPCFSYYSCVSDVLLFVKKHILFSFLWC